MNEFNLIKPTAKYADQIAEYRAEFLSAGDVMDGCGSLRQMENIIERNNEGKAYVWKKNKY